MTQSLTMQSIAFSEKGGVDVLKQTTVPKPSPAGREILVKIKGVSVNPIDYKVRAGRAPFPNHEIIGWDASGIVEALGPDATKFQVGDEVMFSGSVMYQGCYAEYATMDERLVGHKPKSLSFADAAGLPLVTLTAWESLVEKLEIPVSSEANHRPLLIINGAGGVGSVATQIARKVLNLETVITTASRPETFEWCKKMGATHVLDHSKPLQPQLEELGLAVDYVFISYNTDAYLETVVDLIQPFGKIVSIGETFNPLAFQKGINKSLTYAWESVFAKSLAGINMDSQGEVLTQVAQLLDGQVFTPISTVKMIFSLETLKKSHELLETGRVIGKIIFEMPNKWA
ncbi:NADPH:quinone reductase [Basidiobolus meristosporus CBS 931.73]|uniref:NADPH:quinone reductase n=1 Tax=Basidiobolus meristosporus CBS 931.73 TaxID=1314790 RepID=A0A1Y1YFH5_9FUNG|nr:NADPH:quinone reductase [Basidiobolus meristosporus CBS 931.73]|eukprot:ORX96456.1 NADPH:quinone reductase [Basidiobolus meristosporus CBS 931.73]